MRKINEMVIDLLKSVYPLGLDAEEIARIVGYDKTSVRIEILKLQKEGMVRINDANKFVLIK